MPLAMTDSRIDSLWDKGFRPYEIYTYNRKRVFYLDSWHEAGTIPGWDIQFVFSTRDLLKSYPYFDAVIGVDSMANVEYLWEG